MSTDRSENTPFREVLDRGADTLTAAFVFVALVAAVVQPVRSNLLAGLAVPVAVAAVVALATYWNH